MEYREHSPSSALAPFVQCYWTLTSTAAAQLPPSRVFPDGCMEIIFHFAEPFSRVDESGAAERQAKSLVAGQIWAPVTLQPGVRADVLGIRFRSTGAMPFLGFPLHETAGRIVSLEDVWGRRARSWRDALGDAPDRIAVLERHLLACRPQRLPALHALSPRQFRRRFQQQVGLSPKLFARIRRFQRALTIVGTIPFADAAAKCGYYDQSHLIRDFRQFTGEPPSKWLEGMADSLIQSATGE
ncbi:MAG: helix-turn-helix domain-containing protein [Acidobacteriota bacterium]